MNLNFFEKPKKRKIYLIGKKGSLEACLNSNKIIIYIKGKKIVKIFKFKKNDIFKKEIKFFISSIKLKKKISNDLNINNGIKTLKFALKLKQDFYY